MTKRSEGAFEFEDQVNKKGVLVRNRVNTFVKESKDYDKTLSKPAEGTDSFWTWVLDNTKTLPKLSQR